MKTNRRSFLRNSALSAGLLGALPVLAADSSKTPSFVTKAPNMRIGMVTYNLAQDWDIETIIKNLQSFNSEFCQHTLEQLSKKSPTSLKVTLKALQSGQQLVFDDCMQQEYYLTYHFLQHHDFIEGIRALLIDKDNKPIWQPSELNQVTEQQVKQYFMPVSE